MAITIDINCDLGEGVGNDELLMPYLSSCNIACGGHTGDEKSMALTADLALKNQVRIGAHPSFPDKKHFGRKEMNMSESQLFETIQSQIESLSHVLRQKNAILNHIKPHGALYNLAAIDESVADVVVSVVKSFDKNLILYVPYQSKIANRAIEKGVPIKYEAFADRNYNDDLTLVSRQDKMALIHDANEMFNHVYEMIFYRKVTTINGVGKAIKVDTICVHGDAENVLQNLQDLVQKLHLHHINVK